MTWNAMRLSAPKKTSAMLTVPLAATMLLAGCGGNSNPDAAPSTTAASAPTSTAAPTAPTPPTTTATTDVNIPAAARAHTTAGAEAFTKFFFARLNRSWSTADPSLLPPLSDPGCKTCSAFSASAESFQSRGQHYKGVVFSVTSVAALGQGLKGQEVLVLGEQKPGAIVNKAGNVIKTSAAQRGKFVMSVRWTKKGWNALELQVQR